LNQCCAKSAPKKFFSGLLGKVAISFVEWSGDRQQEIVADWTIVRDEATAKAQIIKAPRAFRDRTSISGCTILPWRNSPARRSTPTATPSTYLVTAPKNAGRAVTDARDEALAKGVTINGLVILSERRPVNDFHTNPSGGLDAYYRNNVIGGPGALLMVAENSSSFGQTILNKLSAEITWKPTR
jgi:hypothetical protein